MINHNLTRFNTDLSIQHFISMNQSLAKLLQMIVHVEILSTVFIVFHIVIVNTKVRSRMT